MATITEDYVSFETAKLLKEKGFSEETRGYCPIKGDATGRLMFGSEYNHNHSQVQISAPTLQMAMKWLRETHEIIPIILTGEHSQNPLYYWFRIDIIIEGKLKDAIYREDEKEYSSYEEACEVAIKYCLENLIKED